MLLIRVFLVHKEVYRMRKIIAVTLCLLILVSSLVGCGNKGYKSSNANIVFSSQEKNYSVFFLSTDTSERLHLNQTEIDKFNQLVSDISLDYTYDELYGIEECYDRIFIDNNVATHAYSALDSVGKLTAEHLSELVKDNNKSFLEETEKVAGFYHEPDDEYLLSVCQLIVDTVNEIKSRYPDIDYERVYCNLGNLKILYKTGLLDNASVTPEMILQLSDGMLQIVNIMSDSGIRDVLIHGIMHMIQFGCSCEKIQNCSRHVGFTFRWDDVPLQGNDWVWLAEGSAEQNMCMLMGDEPLTYQNKINYIQSLNLATFLHQDTPADYVQTLCFYSDPNRLFDLFDAHSKEEITEIARLMEAIQIIQESPDDFLKAYQEKYGVDTSDTAEMDKLRYTLKPAICVTLAKVFYSNLANALQNTESVTSNDVFYLLRIFEAAMDYHTLYSSRPERIEINSPFLDRYKQIRAAFLGL